MLLEQTQSYIFLKLKYFITMTLICIGFSVKASEPVIASYYSSNNDPVAVSMLPASKLSHILYAFLALCGDNKGANEDIQKAIALACVGKAPYSAVIFNEEQVKAELDAFRLLKSQHPHLRILPSFGGWTLSYPFHGLAKSESARKHFVRSAVALIAQYDVFDGIDIDWEFPGGGGNSQITLSGEDAQQEKLSFTLLMQDLRNALDKLSSKTNVDYQLTAAVNGSKNKTQAIDWRNTAPFMDYIFAMTYDFAVGNGQAAHHTNLFTKDQNSLSTEVMINNLLSAGVPANKLVVGVAFYTRGWKNSGWQDNDFSKKSKAISIEGYSYKELQNTPPTGYQYGYDTQAEAAYYFNPTNNGFISFDDPRSIQSKATFVKNKKLAGLFSWQIMQDNGDLLNAMYQGMHSNIAKDDKHNLILGRE